MSLSNFLIVMKTVGKTVSKFGLGSPFSAFVNILSVVGTIWGGVSKTS
jgi:hypothetical protein